MALLWVTYKSLTKPYEKSNCYLKIGKLKKVAHRFIYTAGVRSNVLKQVKFIAYMMSSHLYSKNIKKYNYD